TNAEGSNLTTFGVALGTPAYMAPEQASADPLTDHRADIYAFGVMAYELLTGQPPFAGRPPSATLAAHVKEEPEPVDRRREARPPALAPLVMACLGKPARHPAAERRRGSEGAGKRRYPRHRPVAIRSGRRFVTNDATLACPGGYRPGV